MNRDKTNPVSEEQLNAYLDDELDLDEKLIIDEQLKQDSELSSEEHDLRQIRSMLRDAYRQPPKAPYRGKLNAPPRRALTALAAGLLLAIGAIAGWYGNQHLTGYSATEIVAINDEGLLDTEAATKENLLLHISSSDPDRMAAALNYAERLLASARNHNRNDFRLEVVANDGGIEMLRRDTSPFQQRIEALLNEYDNVSFLACANALRKLRERGVKVELLPGTRSNNTALDEIVHRLEGGWRYLKV